MEDSASEGVTWVDVARGWLGGHAPATDKNYERTLRDFAAFCDERGVADPLLASTEDLNAYRRNFEDLGRANSTIEGKFVALSSFYRSALRQGVIGKSPIEGARRPRIRDDHLVRLMPPEQYRAMLERGCVTPRQEALVRLLAVVGLRVGEVGSLNTGDFHFDETDPTLTFERRDGARTSVHLDGQTARALRDHLGNRQTGPLFLGAEGGRMNRHAMSRVIRRVARQANIDVVPAPQMLRNSAVSMALEAKVSFDQVKSHFGYSDTRRLHQFRLPSSAADPVARQIAEFLSTPASAGDLIPQAERLLNDHQCNLIAPVVLASAALESWLLAEAGRPGVSVRGKPGIKSYLHALVAARRLPRDCIRDVERWAEIRNTAAHTDGSSLSRPDARRLVAEIKEFLNSPPKVQTDSLGDNYG